MNQLKVSKSAFKAKALDFFRQVETSGESIIITNHGKPTLEVRPFRQPDDRPLDKLRGTLITYHQPLDPIASDEWEAAQ